MVGTNVVWEASIVLRERYLLLNSLQVWWPESSKSVVPLLSKAPFVTVMQCDGVVADALNTYAFRHRPFHTLLLDLSQTESDLSRGLSHGCRGQINKAKTLGYDIVINQETDRAFRLINDYVRRSGYRPSIPADEWEEYCEYCDIFLIRHKGEAVAAHVVLVNGSERARLLFSATIDRSERRSLEIASPLNRMLHWSEFQYYRGRGVKSFDFGGVVLNETSPLYSITKFKQSFGGELVTESILRLTRFSAMRRTLRLAARLKAATWYEGR